MSNNPEPSPIGIKLHRSWAVLKRAGKSFIASDPMPQAATIAYYTIFSLPAVMILIIMAAASFYDEAVVRTALLGQAGQLIGHGTAQQLGTMLENAQVTETRFFAKVIGLVTLVISAGTVFASLQSALNKVWEVEAKPKSAVVKYLASRLISLALVASFGFLMLVSLVLDAALVAFSERLTLWLSGVTSVVVTVLNIAVSYAIITFIFALLFKVLPDARIRLRNVWLGAFVTAVLFTLGKYLISMYIAYGNVGDAYGAAGAIVIILVWVYYSTVIMLFGAHLTHAYTVERNERIEPSAHAEHCDPAVAAKVATASS